jgi:catechol 2,3-dioxygenase-like lactoylglutathione lyase family enzyme
MIKGLHHIGVATPNLDGLRAFYVTHFHGEVLAEFAWDADSQELSDRLGLERSAGRLVMLGFGATRLELFEFAEPVVARGPLRSVAKPGFSHIAFEVDDAAQEFAVSAG